MVALTAPPRPPRRLLRPARLAMGALAVMVVAIVAGNALILGASWWANQTTDRPGPPALPGIDNLEAVDAALWRGAAPTAAGYAALAAAGVGTVVDLRAEPGAEFDAETVGDLGMRSVRLPIRDGQVPDPEQVATFLRVMDEAQGPVFVHCGAGVGRTSTMVGAWLVSQGELNAKGAVRRNLAIGPPSLEQLAFVAGMSADGFDRPNLMVTAASRVLDAPRRLWHFAGF